MWIIKILSLMFPTQIVYENEKDKIYIRFRNGYFSVDINDKEVYDKFILDFQ